MRTTAEPGWRPNPLTVRRQVGRGTRLTVGTGDYARQVGRGTRLAVGTGDYARQARRGTRLAVGTMSRWMIDAAGTGGPASSARSTTKR